MLELNAIYQGDCLKIMKFIDDNSIDVVVTSPPYGVSKSYERQSKTKSYIWRTVWLGYQCFKEFKRIVKPGGYIVWNFGDSGMGRRALGTEVVTTIPMSLWYWPIGRKTGFELQATRIWVKRYAMVTKSFVQNHRPRPCFDYEHIWTFRKPDGIGKERVNENKIGRRGVWSNNKHDEEGMGLLNNPYGITSYDREAVKNGSHGAAFPDSVPFWALTVYSQPGDIVLDPFSGTGTTAVVAKKMGRRYIGIELNEEWARHSAQRLFDTCAEKS